MTKLKSTIQNIFRSFPFQLGLSHLQYNLLLLSIYAFLILLVFGQVGKTYGFHYLFLKPEYFGSTGFLSFFIIGVSLGWLTINWNLTTYILHSHRFPFLATLERPFIKFSFNNFFFPFVFLVLYLFAIWSFERNMEFNTGIQIVLHILGLLSGQFLILGMLSIYFRYTNKDLNREIKLLTKIQEKVEKSKAERIRLEKLFNNFKEGRAQQRVDFFVTERGKVRPVRDVAHYSEEEMLRIFKHNHSNIISFQLLSIVILFVSGLFADLALIQIPAASSVLLLLSLLVSIFGAMTYWFSRWRVLAFVVFLLLWNQLSKQSIFNHLSVAYGLDYTTKADYSLGNFRALADEEQFELDKQATLDILEKWKIKNTPADGSKPKLLVLSSSGGGLKSAVWTFRVLQHLDYRSQNSIMDQSALMVGASGGMIGQAYYRALFQKASEEAVDFRTDNHHLAQLRQDLLNAVLFSYVSTDLFLPLRKAEVFGEKQPLDRAYAFERRLNESTDYLFDYPLSHFRNLEREAKIPILMTSPSIVNDGRILYVSSQDVSYMMCNPERRKDDVALEYDAIDFGLIFKEQNAANLRFSSSIRMNASFPYVLPNVNLPSEPGIQVLDAGLKDNFGLKTAVRFIHVFKDWIEQNTSGVVLVEMRAFERNDEIPSLDNVGVLDGMFNPLSLAADIVKLQNYENDNNLGFLNDLLGEDMLHHIVFTCTSENTKEEIPISLNLSKKEYNEVLENLFVSKGNRIATDRFLDVFNVESED